MDCSVTEQEGKSATGKLLKGRLERIGTWKGVSPASCAHNLHAYLGYSGLQQTKAQQENIKWPPPLSLYPSVLLSLFSTTACCFSFHFKRFKPFKHPCHCQFTGPKVVFSLTFVFQNSTVQFQSSAAHSDVTLLLYVGQNVNIDIVLMLFWIS